MEIYLWNKFRILPRKHRKIIIKYLLSMTCGIVPVGIQVAIIIKIENICFLKMTIKRESGDEEEERKCSRK